MRRGLYIISEISVELVNFKIFYFRIVFVSSYFCFTIPVQLGTYSFVTLHVACKNHVLEFFALSSKLPENIRETMYPQDVDGSEPMANRDAHTMYIGQIVDAYIIR